MKEFDVEMAYGIGFTITGVPAENQKEAIEKAKSLIDEISLLPLDVKVDAGDLEFQEVTFIQESDERELRFRR